MDNIFFFEIEQIKDSSKIFKELVTRKLFFSYFQVDQSYYLLVFNEKSFDPDFLYQSLNQVKELNSKKRILRSFRGFFLYVLEIMNQGKFCKILETNLKLNFWSKVQSLIRQNRKELLLKFLFQNFSDLNQEDLQDQIKSLKKKILEIENQLNKKN